jgi:hypothetical protein
LAACDGCIVDVIKNPSRSVLIFWQNLQALWKIWNAPSLHELEESASGSHFQVVSLPVTATILNFWLLLYKNWIIILKQLHQYKS